MPDEHRRGILLSDEELRQELDLMTDTDTDKLFTGYGYIAGEVSRLVCDMERFLDVELEPMEKLGLGAVYTHTSSGKPLRACGAGDRQRVIERYYLPYHQRFYGLVASKMGKYGRCLIIDCHSFSNDLPFIEGGDDVCIGADSFHTSERLLNAAVGGMESHGYKVAVNAPFSGAIVPLEYYGKEKRIQSIMFEINKRIYMGPGGDFAKAKHAIDDTLAALAALAGAGGAIERSHRVEP
jgi:N-formylglutamate amidohydrolase